MNGRTFEVVVAGGGLIGAVAALGLARSGRSVLLVDRNRPRPQTGAFGMDIRTIACSPGSRRLLEDTGVWSSLSPEPYRKMVVWEEQGTAELTFDAEEVGRSELGWILQNSPTVAAVWDALEVQENAHIELGEVTAVCPEPHRVVVEVEARRHEARLLLGVDGSRSAVRSQVGAEVTVHATGQNALATLVETELPHEGVAYQRFLLDGPLAFLPGAKDRVSSVVWSQPPELATQRADMPEKEFCESVEGALEGRLGRVVAVDRRVVFPLQQQLVADFNPLDRVLLIGDAARVLHPLAGLGANVGFEDVRDLLALVRGLPAGADLGAAGIWRGYARKRRARAWLMVSAMTGFRRAYGDADPLVQWLRNTAIGWLNGARPVKAQIIREALGLGPLASTW